MPLSVNSPHQGRLATLANANQDEPLAGMIRACQTRYDGFRSGFLAAFDNGDYENMAALLDDYRNYAKSREKSEAILSDRTKYYSSILEEIPILLARDKATRLVSDLGLENHNLKMGGVDCVIRIAANPDGSCFHEKKRIDFCLAINTAPNGAGGNWIPLIGLEVKKYCDKTMFGTILETYKSLQIFRPRTYYGFLVEEEARASDVVLNSPIYQQEFILCDDRRSKTDLRPVSPEVLKHFTAELLSAVEDALNVLAKSTAVSGKKKKREKSVNTAKSS